MCVFRRYQSFIKSGSSVLGIPMFDLDDLNEDQCKSELRFEKNDIPRLAKAFGMNGEFVFHNGTKVDTTEALCVLLRRLAYPCRYLDIPTFARSVPELSIIFNQTLEFIYTHFFFYKKPLYKKPALKSLNI